MFAVVYAMRIVQVCSRIGLGQGRWLARFPNWQSRFERILRGYSISAVVVGGLFFNTTETGRGVILLGELIIGDDGRVPFPSHGSRQVA